MDQSETVVPARGQVVARRFRNIVRLSAADDQPLAGEPLAAILPHLEYLHKRPLHGDEAFDPKTGERRAMAITRKQLYYWQAGHLYCPAGFLDFVEDRCRALGYAVAHVTIDDEPRKRPDAYKAYPTALKRYRLRDGQAGFFQAVAWRIRQNRGGIVKAVPAFGKSFCIKALAQLYCKARILVLVPSLALLNQVVNDLAADLPQVGIVGGGKRLSGRVVVATAGSLGSLDDDWDVVVVDEFHDFASQARSHHLARVAARAVVIGLTATPEGRLDGADRRLEGMAGPIIYEFDWDQARALDRVADIWVRWHDVRLLTNPADKLQGHQRKRRGIWQNQERNAIVARSLAAAVAQDQHTLALVATVEHALFLQKAILDAGLPAFALSYSLQDYSRFERLAKLKSLGGMVFGPIDPVDLAATRDQFKAGTIRRLISTGTLGVGFSADSLDVVARAEALGASAIGDEQKGGRVCRTHVGKDRGYVYDYLDQFDRGFHRSAQGRREIYQGLGWNEEPHPYLAGLDRRRGSARRS